MGSRRITALLSPASAKEGVRGLFKSVLDDLDDPRTPRVCLVARSVSSDVFAEGDLRKIIQTGIAGLVGAYSERLKSAKDKGELPVEIKPELVAEVISTSVQGLYRTALLGYERAQLERQVDLFLRSLGL